MTWEEGRGGLLEVVEEDCLGNGVERGEVVLGLRVMEVRCCVCKEGEKLWWVNEGRR